MFGVGAVCRLVEEPDVPPICCTSSHDVGVIADVMGRSIVLLDENTSGQVRPHGLLMAGKTSLSIFSLYTSLFTSTICVTIVPAALCLLFRRAGTRLVNGKMPIFPLKLRLWRVSLRGRPTAARNITFLMCDLC